MIRERFSKRLISLIDPPESVSLRGAPPVLLAVSGGIDSMTMLHLFHSIEYPNYSVATVNFSLRGDESDKDEALVTQWCYLHNIRCFTKRFDTLEYAQQQSISTQMAARELRFKWFEELCKEHSFGYLAVAHNLNDRVETLFINLLRGTGVEGLAAIRDSSSPMGDSIKVIRPILDFTRDEIEQYAKSLSVEYRNDKTNFENNYARNKIRNMIFPLFKEINPSFLKTIDREISVFTQAGDIIADNFKIVRESGVVEVVKGTDEMSDRTLISIDKLLKLNNPQFWLYEILQEFGFSSLVVGSIYNSITKEAGKIFYSPRYRLLKDREYLILSRVPANNEIPNSPAVDIYPRAPHFIVKPSDRVFYLDADKTGDTILFRRWREGDRFTPLGMQGSKKISDYLIDKKRDRFTKEQRVVATTLSGKIICLLGERIDHNYRITDDTKRVLEISLLID